eukprot:10057769-Karenia_brevis.AAC.1
MAYRILKITSTLYRLWAAVRMQNIARWIDTWKDEAMFAGVTGVGAEEAFYTAALERELMRLSGMGVSGA